MIRDRDLSCTTLQQMIIKKHPSNPYSNMPPRATKPTTAPRAVNGTWMLAAEPGWLVLVAVVPLVLLPVEPAVDFPVVAVLVPVPVAVAEVLPPVAVGAPAKRSVEAQVLQLVEAGIRGVYGGGVTGSGIDQVETWPLTV